MSRRAHFWWGLFFGLVGLFLVDVEGTLELDAMGNRSSAGGMTLETLVFCSPGIVFLSAAAILVLRGLRGR